MATSLCPPDLLVVYRISLKTEWDEKTFPKQFPQWRPTAQWSKTVGRETIHVSYITMLSVSIIFDVTINVYNSYSQKKGFSLKCTMGGGEVVS